MQVRSDEDESRRAAEQLFETAGDDAVAQVAWAGLVYSFVPYLGILFTPVAIIFGIIDLLRAKRRGNIRRPVRGLAVAIILGAVQIFLWYLLYAVPKLGRII